MPPAEPRSPLPDDVSARENRLRRASLDERSGVADCELAGILDRVGQRRRARAVLETVELRRPLGRLDGTSDAVAEPDGSTPTATPAPTASSTPISTVATATPASVPSPSGGSATSGRPGQVLSIEQVGPTVRIIRVGRPASFSYVAGQHLKIGTTGTRRGTYSIASAPHEAHVEICVKLVPDGRLTPALFSVRPGDTLDSDWRAKGSFRFDERARAHVMVATGAGIAPLRSLLRAARQRGATGPVTVLHGASHPDELPYHDEMLELSRTEASFRYVPTVSRPAAPRSRGWSGPTGRVDDLARAALASLDPGNTRVYVCGNGGMVKAVAADATGRGFSVSAESFG